MPRLITRRTLAAEAARRWLDHYGYHITGKGSPPLYGGLDPKAVYAALVALGPNPAPDAVDAAVGNGSWTAVPECDECKRGGHAAVVLVGDDPPDYESSTALLCGDCLRRAAELAG